MGGRGGVGGRAVYLMQTTREESTDMGLMICVLLNFEKMGTKVL